MLKGIFTLILLLFFIAVNAQDPHFSQFYANPLYLNPAFAGTANGPRFSVNYRNQWLSVKKPFITYTASYDQHFDGIGGGLGMQFMYDKAGDGNLATTSGSLAYSYHLNVTHNFTIKAALQTSVQQKSIDYSKLLFGDMIDPRLGFIYETEENIPPGGVDQTKPILDFSAGFMGFSRKFYAGVAAHHLNEPRITFLNYPNSRLPMRFTTHIGMLIPLENTRHPRNFFSPNILFMKQASFMQFNIGGYYIKESFIAGLWLRQTSVNMDAFIILLGIKKDPVKIGYSYDVTFSDAYIGAKGSHELALIIELKTIKRLPSTKWRKLICPSF